jgi:polo-like kinase 1
LKKKVGLFHHFKGYLKDDDVKGDFAPIDPRNLVYIKRWFRSKHSVIFRMSNKTVQVIFVDQTELIINSTTKRVAYFNKTHERTEYPIQDIMES